MTGVRVLLGGCALLVAVVAAEAVSAPSGDVGQPSAPPSHPAAAPPAPLAPEGDRSAAWSTTLLGRPLFAPDRRPIAGAAGPLAHEAALPRLSGIMLSPTLRLAIFEDDHAPRARIVAEGASVAGWMVAGIGTDSVTLSRDGSPSITMRPRFAAGSPQAAPARPHPAPISRWTEPAATGILRTRWSNPHLQP